MVRKRDVMKNELRAYFGLKSIRGWEQNGGWKLRGLNTEHIWDKLREEYEKKVFPGITAANPCVLYDTTGCHNSSGVLKLIGLRTIKSPLLP